ncbi:histidine triad (HIT) protein [Nocardioides sp. Root614]|nr:histidine triad (HIT) protein [Nocardioides sp. Root614]KRA88391.1 histidine triad (HIT) protein [Nocardioides sp. Root682]
MLDVVSADPDCLFCKIIAGAIPAEIVHDGERTFAFRDINPQAPLHVLVVPRDHAPNAAASAEADAAMFAEIATTARAVAAAEGYDDYRLVFNTGAGVGQTVFHTHGHLLAGRSMGWPPG